MFSLIRDVEFSMPQKLYLSHSFPFKFAIQSPAWLVWQECGRKCGSISDDVTVGAVTKWRQTLIGCWLQLAERNTWEEERIEKKREQRYGQKRFGLVWKEKKIVNWGIYSKENEFDKKSSRMKGNWVVRNARDLTKPKFLPGPRRFLET